MNKCVLRLSYPGSCQNERKWIADVLLGEFLGLDYIVEDKEGEISIEADGKELILPDTFFAQAKDKWLSKDSLPLQPLEQWDTRNLDWDINLISPVVPIIYGSDTCEVSTDQVRLGLDIFGTAFFMLSRYEEAVKDARDQFDRFPAAASLALQEGFLDRPIVNEYLEILWAAMKHLWPKLERKKRGYRTLVSCDVDVPYAWGIKSVRNLVRQIGGDFIKRKNPVQGIKSGLNYIYARLGDYGFDAFHDKFQWMMEVNEKEGNRVAFYFMTVAEESEVDGCYSIDEPVIRKLLSNMNDRGHEIGLHCSFNTFNDAAQTSLEADKLRSVLNDTNIPIAGLGNRQHYLRWKSPVTAQNLDAAGIAYDTTLTFVDHAGFRCGVCYEYPLYDVVERRMMNLNERPLVVMEKSIFESQYMGKSLENDGLEVIEQLKQRCRQFNGDFTLLWHNNQFPDQKTMEIYKTIIQ